MTLQIYAEKRNVFGKKLKSARKEGKIPAVLYGKSFETKSLFVPAMDFRRIWKEAGESAVIELNLAEEKKKIDVLIKDVALEPINNEPIHIDFYRVEMDRPITANVPIIFQGVSPAVKEKGGILVKVLHELKVEALPKNLPKEIIVDISHLKEIEDQISVGDLNLPPDVEISAKPEEIVILVEKPQEEEIKTEMKIEDIEVEQKGKKLTEEGTEESK
ncbi:MAG: 50S ribosomal protein L25 [Patescibacteria group bacterium]